MYRSLLDNTKLTGSNSTDLLFMTEPENKISPFPKELGYLPFKLIRI